MLKLGVSFKSNISSNQIDEIIRVTGCQLAGVFAEDSSNNSDIDDLLSECDILLVACSNERKFEIASKAIKKGVVPIINNIDGLNSSTLSSLQQLANEIGIRVGFVELGHSLDDFSLPFDIPFILHLKRYLKKPITESAFNQYLIYDIATALKFSKLDVRKVRAYGLPICTDIPQSLMVMVDFSNNSVFTYNLQQTDDIEQLNVEVFNGSNSSAFDIPVFNCLAENISVKTCIRAISSIVNNSASVNTIELAIETTRLADTIQSKINQ